MEETNAVQEWEPVRDERDRPEDMECFGKHPIWSKTTATCLLCNHEDQCREESGVTYGRVSRVPDILSAFEAGQPGYLKELVQKFRNSEGEDEYEDLHVEFHTALESAITSKNHEFIKWALFNVPCLFLDPPHGFNLASAIVASEGDLATMMLIVRYGPENACINDYDGGPDAIDAAIVFGHDSIVALLLADGYRVPDGIYMDVIGWGVDTNWANTSDNPVSYCMFRGGELAKSDPAASNRYLRTARLLSLCKDE